MIQAELRFLYIRSIIQRSEVRMSKYCVTHNSKQLKTLHTDVVRQDVFRLLATLNNLMLEFEKRRLIHTNL